MPDKGVRGSGGSRRQRRKGLVVHRWFAEESRSARRAAAEHRVPEFVRARAELQAVYDAVGDGLLVLDVAGKVVFANDTMARFGGHDDAAALRAAFERIGEAAPLFDLRSPEGEPFAPDAWPIARALRGEAFRDLDVEVRRRDTGEVRWYSYSAQPVRDAAGAQFLSVIVARDVTARKRDEQVLRESEERARTRAEELQRAVEELRVVLDTVPAAVWIARDPAGDVIDANRFGAELLRRPPGSNVSVTAPGDERPMNFRPTRGGKELGADELPIQAAARHGRESRDFEFDLTFEDGTVRHLLGNATPLRDASQAPRGSVGAFIDITDRKRAEQALLASEQEARRRAATLEAILDCTADGVIVYDRQGRTLRSSPAADEIVGVPPGERVEPVVDRVGRQYEIFSEDGRRLAPEETIAVRATLRAEAIRGEINRVHVPGKEPRWLMMSSRPLVVAGEQTGAVVSLTDITQRKCAEAELAVVTRLYAVLSQVNEAIVRTRDAAVLYRDVCRIVAAEGGFPLAWIGLVNGRGVVPACAAGRATAYLQEITVALNGPFAQGPTATCVREDRPVINDDFEVNPSTLPWRAAAQRHGLRASASFPLHRAGQVIGALVLYAARPGAFTPKQVRLLDSLSADLSYALDALEHERLRTAAEAALREREQALRDADRRKDEFLSMLSHELRNPLAPIRNAVQVLRRAAPGTEPATRARVVIERQAEHMARLVDDLLDLTRIARGKIQLRKAAVDLREVARGAADDFREVLDPRVVTFDVRVTDAPATIDADRTRINQVIGNLLHNARKFTRDGDRIELAVEVRDGAAELRVRDTGVGIDPALQPRLFQPFVQGERTLARSEGGLGLGLALVKGIVELHGGTVQALSAGPGQGAEFVARLPLRPVREESAPAPRHPDSAASWRILVVDDNVDSAESLCDLLRLLGHEVDVAHDGPTALGKVRAAAPDVVVCDIGLPGMDGYEVARTLRRDAGAGLTRLLALSGYAQGEDRQRALDAGFDAHLAKPVELPELLRALAREP
ncbi:MAG TPA: PAS domain S-box protein [Anaeromyxobacter sp.]|nr:PAS domain S-box protein [Anaeromyxobacter sp.]